MKQTILRQPQTTRAKATSIILIILFFTGFTFLALTGKSQTRLNEIPVKIIQTDSTFMLSIQASTEQFNKLMKIAIKEGVKARQDSEIMILDELTWIEYKDKKYYVYPSDLFHDPTFESTKVSEVRKYLIDYFKK